MSAVAAEDDSRTRFVLYHYRYDEQRNERRNVVVGAWDREAEFAAHEQRLREELSRRHSAAGGDPRERGFGSVLPPGALTAGRRSRILARAQRCARRVASGLTLRDGPPERITRLSMPAVLHGCNARVKVGYTVGADPAALGFDAVAPGQPWEQFVGFPVLDATVSADLTGYRGLCGWVQLITRTEPDSGEVQVGVDKVPFAEATSDPLTMYGYLPRFFDAPANPGDRDGLWLAELFLVEIDVRRPAVCARAGLSWGYYLRRGHPYPLQVQPIPGHLWRVHANQLRRDFPLWAFD